MSCKYVGPQSLRLNIEARHQKVHPTQNGGCLKIQCFHNLHVINLFSGLFYWVPTLKLKCERFYYSTVHVRKFKLNALTYLFSYQTSCIMPNIVVDCFFTIFLSLFVKLCMKCGF